MIAAPVRSASIDGDPGGMSSASVAMLRANRSLGAGAAAAIAVAATLIGAGLNGGWFLALGIPAATLSG